MTRMVIYVQPSMYEDSTLSHAIGNYATAVEHDLGWDVNKRRLDEYINWRSIRIRIMNDDPNVVLLAGDKIDYPYFSAIPADYFNPLLPPFYSDKEPSLADGKVAIRVNYYKVDRAVSILQADRSSLVHAFNKFKQIKVERYKNVCIFDGCDVKHCLPEHYSFPTEYNYNFCKCCSNATVDTALKGDLTLLGGRGHGNPGMSACCKGSFSVPKLMNAKLLMLFVTGCNTNSWIKGSERWFGHLVVTNPYLQFFLGGGYGIPCGNITGRVLSQMLNGKTYAEAVMGVTIDQFFTAYGNPAFHLSEEFAGEFPPVTPPPQPPLPKKRYVEFKSIPQGAEIWLKKR